MADDGMLLNFELPSDAFAPVKRLKGGSWKDRLTARKSAEYGRQKAQERAGGSRKSMPNYGDVQSEEEEYVAHAQRPAKRSRTDTGSRGKAPQQNGYVSSLFTYNPRDALEKPAEDEDVPVEDDAPVEPSNAPLSDELATFTNLGLSSTIASHLLNKLNIKAPTAIQRQALQHLCATSTDAFIQAETGSGKTLAYLLPIVHHISQISKQMKAAGQDFTRSSGLFGLILAPTRELSKQISTVLEGLLSCCHWIVGGIVTGGENKKSEKARLRKGMNILVATPGRLADHINSTEVLDVSKVRWLVLDEGDQLMKLGFEQDLQRIVGLLNLRGRAPASVPGLPERRTTVLCSATIKTSVEQLRSIALKDAVSIVVDSPEATVEGEQTETQAFSAPAQLKQSYAIVPPKQRLVTLTAVLRQAFKRKGSVMKCIVFIDAADSVDFHFELLIRERGEKVDTDELKVPRLSKTGKITQGTTISETRTNGVASFLQGTASGDVHIFRLHGSLQQHTRTSTLKAFATCEDPAILVCTDVMSRGLDLPNVDLVVEYDPPASKDDHLHRIGRTARAGKDGRAMIFLLPGCEEEYVSILKEGKPRNLTKHDADELLKKGFAPANGVVKEKSWEEAATDWQMDIERWALEHPKHLEQARRAYQSHIRAYATHVVAERHMFDLKQMHLGHLAKAFALRDKPSSIRVPGQRPGKAAVAKTKEVRRTQAGKSAAGSKRKSESALDDVDGGENDEREARRRMMAKMKMNMSGASEFNLG
ncbi:ATP-dependent RNA helicase dbp7 [Recurvomyces mirabilis]|uniref:ATP-dependent RNA helicase n=1 Tax=Recurvomyces mirabilis TaxID=574656 RepID=A0AAE1C4S5_9PEZI|nr:ATP-dependent RNA helicase dbp7 [Recurvomyces mirabilis]KAK5160643.1 ATP-dependent RNA helicase dbp7 [Recurvomyces mirabilis]